MMEEDVFNSSYEEPVTASSVSFEAESLYLKLYCVDEL